MRVACFVFSGATLTEIEAFAEACLRFSPDLCLKRPGALFIEIGKCQSLYSEESFLNRAQVLLKRFSLQAKIAIGDSIVLALVKCLYKTENLYLIPLQALHEFFDPFLIEHKSQKIVIHIIESLERLGISNVSNFLELPTSQLSSRFGKVALIIRMRLKGEMQTPWPHWKPREKIDEQIILEDSHRCAELEPLLFYMKSGLDKIFLRLWGRGLACSVIKVGLQVEKFSTILKPKREWDFEFALPQTSVRGVIPIIRERLDRALAKEPLLSQVEKVELSVEQTVPGFQSQRNLFHSKEDHEQMFNTVVSQFAESLGKERVFRPEVLKESIPEKSWRKGFKDQFELPDFSNYIPIRPTRLLKNPLPVHLTDHHFVVRRKTYQVLQRSCPEDISKDWIDDEVNRTYFKIDLDGTHSAWVFKNPDDQYFLHGWFD